MSLSKIRGQKMFLWSEYLGWFSTNHLVYLTTKGLTLHFLLFMIIFVGFICQFSKIYFIRRNLLILLLILTGKVHLFFDFFMFSCVEVWINIMDYLDGLIQKIANNFIFCDLRFLLGILDDKQIGSIVRVFLFSV